MTNYLFSENVKHPGGNIKMKYSNNFCEGLERIYAETNCKIVIARCQITGL